MSRHLAGLRAKIAGDSFEGLFQLMCLRDGIVCVDFPDGCIKYMGPRGLTLKQTEMPFDFMICKNGKSASVDTKSTAENTFPYSAIIPHQLNSLAQVGPQVPAGYVVWFRASDEVVFFDYLTLQRVRPGTSLKPKDGVMLGTSSHIQIQKVLDHATNPTYQTSFT